MYRVAALLCLFVVASGVLADDATLHFTLLTWNDADASPEYPSAVGMKPGRSSRECDWLLFTEDDYAYASGWNPLGAMSHNIADPSGSGGSTFVMAPSLSGEEALTLGLSDVGSGSWDVRVWSQEYVGQATTVAQMNQMLVSEGDPAALNPDCNVDGLPNAGTWKRSAAEGWSLSYVIDFYLATNTDGNPDPNDVDATFDDRPQVGSLIPVSELTEAGMEAVELSDPVDFFDGDFELYLLEEIAPRLPVDATCLLVVGMEKSHPVFTDSDVSISLNSLVGNMTIAYSTDPLPLVVGDINGDGVVDLSDYGMMADCLAGPGVLVDSACAVADFEGDDGDVDLADFGVFQGLFVGE